jgi:hypothetical protein
MSPEHEGHGESSTHEHILCPMNEDADDCEGTEDLPDRKDVDFNKDTHGTDENDEIIASQQYIRNLVRMLQCVKCSLPLREPIALPCGNALCKECLPLLHIRSNISYPATPQRRQGFVCPFPGCGADHAIGDCGRDVTLCKVLDVVKQYMSAYDAQQSPIVVTADEKDEWSMAGVPRLRPEGELARYRYPGGIAVTTYKMAADGLLNYGSELAYTIEPTQNLAATPSELESMAHALDLATLSEIKEHTRSEGDCQICYALFVDPVTTPCGHTFCRPCLQRVLDHSPYCPICRREIHYSPMLSKGTYPANKRLTALIDALAPTEISQRKEQLEAERRSGGDGLNVPLFVCTLSLPGQPTFLHIFEPRYRLMIRRALEGNRRFGMLLPNGRNIPQGQLGPVPFLQYGTLLHIVNAQFFPDGRILIETVGVSRFRVVNHGQRDGYLVGKIERVDDISLAEEEAIEMAETLPPPPSYDPENHLYSDQNPAPSTEQLMQYCATFVREMQSASAPWLSSRILEAYGPCPYDDPLRFAWWFAAVLPLSATIKYHMLASRSVRQRLKICKEWIDLVNRQL